MRMTFTLLFVFISLPAMAVDSSWLLCRGTAELYEREVNLVVNSYEHRDGVKPNGDTNRSNQLTFIFGGHKLDGQFDSSESDSAKIHLQDKEGRDYLDGDISIDYQTYVMTLKGKIYLFGDDAPSAIYTTFNCEELN